MSSTDTITPLVSVALCTYNGAQYLQRQLDTILQQTCTNMELIIVDDASTDNTLSLLQSCAAKDKRVKLFSNETNLGFNQNFQKAIMLCAGEWIAIADQDDVWHTNKIEKMIRQWNHHSVLLHCSSQKFTSEQTINHTSKPPTKGFNGTSVAAIAAKNTVEGHTILFHRSLIEKAIPFPSLVFYDWWLGAVAAANGGVQWIPEILVYRRIHEHNAYEKQIAPHLDEKETWQQHLIAFLQVKGLETKDKTFITNCLQLINKPATEQQWRRFILQHQHLFFYYKKGIFAFLSRWKHSKKMAKKMAAIQ